MIEPTPTEVEIAINENASAYDAWFRAKVERAMAPAKRLFLMIR